MPRRDGNGPTGKGPGTGRGAGRCAGGGTGNGVGRGFGQRRQPGPGQGFGAGPGGALRRRRRLGFGPPAGPADPDDTPADAPPSDASSLRARLEVLEKEISSVARGLEAIGRDTGKR